MVTLATQAELVAQKRYYLKDDENKPVENADDMLEHVRDVVFPFVKDQNDGPETLYAKYMTDARLTITVPSLLQEAVSILDEINISSHSHDVQGDIYEELLGELQQTGLNGQFRTPRHIIQMMAQMIRM